MMEFGDVIKLVSELLHRHMHAPNDNGPSIYRLPQFFLRKNCRHLLKRAFRVFLTTVDKTCLLARSLPDRPFRGFRASKSMDRGSYEVRKR